MNKLYNAMSNLGTTENGALTHTSSGNAVLDLFSMGGALRSRSNDEVYTMLDKAFNEDPILATRCLFYLRDARGGQGERKLFNLGLAYLENRQKEIAEKVYGLVPEYGRWDDLYAFTSSNMKKLVYTLMNKTLLSDAQKMKEGKSISLLAKWMGSINASSADSRRQALEFCRFANMTKKDYRKTLSMLRKYLEVTETYMSSKNWGNIDYEKVPSVASLKHRNAFIKNDKERYENFIKQVNKGEKKINASVVYPSDIVKSLVIRGGDETLEALWKNLPNYIEGEEQALVVCDTSGSMSSTILETQPIFVAMALTLYFAERNKGDWKDHFITFSDSPVLQKIQGTTLYEKIQNLDSADWGMSTDLNKVFKLILDRAKASNLDQKDMPSKVFIVSDMEFNSCGGNKTNYEAIKQMYKDAGYKVPTIVFWNVNSMQNNSPVTMNDNGVVLVSGYSPSIFKNLLGNKDMSPMSIMLEVLNGDRYKDILA